MFKRLILAIVLMACSTSVYGLGKIQGFVEDGGQKVSVAGFQSTTSVQRSYPSATVTVYIAGTSTLATIYADSILTAKANPFTASAAGLYEFYADGCFDIRFSAGGITTPFTRSGICTVSGAIFAAAKCDNSTNDRATIQAALDTATLAGGGKVILPAGVCRIATALLPGPNTTIEGAGSNATTLYITDKMQIAISVSDAFVTIRDLTITQETAGVYDTSGTQAGISGDADADNLRIERVYARDFDKQAINVDGASDTYISELECRRIGRECVYFVGAVKPQVIGAKMDEVYDSGVAFNSTTTGGIVSSSIFTNCDGGVTFHGTDGVVSSSEFYDNTIAILVKQVNNGLSSAGRIVLDSIVIDGIGLPDDPLTPYGIELRELDGPVIISNSYIRPARTEGGTIDGTVYAPNTNVIGISNSQASANASIVITGCVLADDSSYTASNGMIELKGGFDVADITNTVINTNSNAFRIQTTQTRGIVTIRNVKMIPMYSVGSVAVTNGSPTVTGTGTNWSASWNGRTIWIDNVPYTITTVDSTTQITLSSNYTGTSTSVQGWNEHYVISTVSSGSFILFPAGSGVTRLEIADSFSATGAVTTFATLGGIAVTTLAMNSNDTSGAALLSGTGGVGSFSVVHFAGGLRVGNNVTTSPTITSGSGDPEGVVTAPVGSLWLRTNGGASTTLCVKESGSGNTGWVCK